MTRYVITERSDEFDFWDPVVDLPAMQPGDSVRLTMQEGGAFDVVPLIGLGTRWVSGRSPVTFAGMPVWVDIPEQEPEQENDR